MCMMVEKCGPLKPVNPLNKPQSNTCTMASPRFKASVVNLTPHPVSVFNVDGKLQYEVPADGIQVRATASVASVGWDWAISVGKEGEEVDTEVRNAPEYDGLTGLDEFTHKFGDAALHTSIIVSDTVARFMTSHAARFRGRCRFVLAPDTNPGRGVRGKDGAIIGTRGFLYYGDMSA